METQLSSPQITANNEPEFAISACDLKKSYGEIDALRGVSFNVKRGEIFALLGPNGAGKTTLTRILCTLLRPTSGGATILGFDLLKQRHNIRNVAGYMPQSYVLYDDLTAVENLRFFGRAYGLHGGRLSSAIEDALTLTELFDRRNDLVHTFSGGMRQRLSLACAFIHSPQLLFLDEPTAGVDLKLRKNFWDRFRQLSEQGVTIFVTTHQMDEAEYCRRIAFIHAGRIVIDDTPENIRKRGLARATIVVSGERRVFESADIEAELPILIQGMGGDAARIDRIEIAKTSLEDILRDQIAQRGEEGRC